MSENFEDDPVKSGVLIFFSVVLVIFMLAFLGFALRWFLAPAEEDLRAKVYDKSRTYNQGMAVDLDDLCRQRKLAPDAGTKAILADTIRLRSSRYTGELPPHIQECVNEVR